MPCEGSNPSCPAIYADIAQSAEHRTCNAKVVGSIPIVSSTHAGSSSIGRASMLFYASVIGRLQLLQNKGIECYWFKSNLPAQINLLFRIHTANIKNGKIHISFFFLKDPVLGP